MVRNLFLIAIFERMKIVADRDIPFLRGILEPYADVVYLPGAAISARDAADADALIVRTRTRCDRTLLEGSRVRFIGTATFRIRQAFPLP